MTPLVAVRLAWAGLLLGFPRLVERAAGGGANDRTWLVLARVLGTRHLIEAGLELKGTPPRAELAAVVDSLHALSVTALVSFDRRRWRAALLDALMAWVFAAWSWRSVAGPRVRARTSPVLIGSGE